jgi:hypothetical protein
MERLFTTNASGSRAQRPDSGRKDAQGEYSADNLFIADSQNGRIRCVDASTGMITTKLQLEIVQLLKTPSAVTGSATLAFL